MPKFACSYAYDVPHYADFVVEAPSREAAKAVIDQALADGRFSPVSGTAWYENQCNDRVFVHEGEADDNYVLSGTMEELDGILPASKPTPP